MIPWVRGTVGPWVRGSVGPWVRGSVDRVTNLVAWGLR